MNNVYIVEPIGVHKATIVWLHDIGLKGVDSVQPLQSLGLPNIKWICPTAPTRRVTSLGGEETTAWCDITKVSESMHHDFEALDNVNSFVAGLFSSEPEHVIKGVGGVGLGAAQALYFASNYAFGRVTINLKIVVGINGWLPSWTTLRNDMYSAFGTFVRAGSLILLTYGTSDDIAFSAFARICTDSLHLAGFPIIHKQCGGDHVMNDLRVTLPQYLRL
ncbi:hypothetical protein EUTSA_v10012252mg [Eutrema salsugineum]|uniref:Phospholipase/carboxylesterase/thioesterase domain-containing protein n=2 Tax=Eutrema salsugineum TaxID=72664 RepID=V4MFT7_EUTSA|nr:hypothetical protein EUTSA_v10012252mg [Eutrema salsugineum]